MRTLRLLVDKGGTGMSASLEKVTQTLKEVIDAPIASYFESCVHCGLCAEACLFYTETGDPKYTPIHKVEPLRRVYEQEFTLLGRLKKLVGLSRPITDDELDQWQELVYDSCTLCGRCSLVCPVGNDIVYMIRRFREGMAVSGHVPDGIRSATKRTLEIGGPMGLKWPAVANVLRKAGEATGVTIPVDQEGADYLVLLSSMEIVNYPEYIEALAKIFNKAGISFTVASDAFEATNAGIQIGSSDLAKVIVSRIVDAAERLKVKYVLSPECGHAYMAIRWEGPNLIGRPFTLRGGARAGTARRAAPKGRAEDEGHVQGPAHPARPLPDRAPRRRAAGARGADPPGGGELHPDRRPAEMELVLRRRRRRVGDPYRRGRSAARQGLPDQEAADRGGGGRHHGDVLRQLPHRDGGRRSTITR